MINRALSKISTIKIFIMENETERDAKKKLLKENILISEDWRILAETKTILEPFYKQTIYLQSRAKKDSYRAI